MSLTHQHVIDGVAEAIRRALPAGFMGRVPSEDMRLEISPKDTPGQITICALNGQGTEVAHCVVTLAVEIVTPPAAAAPAPAQQPEHQWIEGVWGDVRIDDITLGADGNEWVVAVSSHNWDDSDLLAVTVFNGEQTFTFNPSICQPVTYRRATPRESSQEADSLINCVD